MERRGHFQDIRELGQFITSFWGVLALLSVILASINSLVAFVPLHPTIPTIATAAAIIAAFFAFLYAYVEGEEEGAYVEDPTGYRHRAPTRRTPMPRTAFSRFAWAMLALAVYLALLALHGAVQDARQPGSAAIAAATVPLLLVSYAALFGFLTAAFSSLAVVHRIAAIRYRAPRRRASLPAAEAEATEAIEIGPADPDPAVAPELRIDQAH